MQIIEHNNTNHKASDLQTLKNTNPNMRARKRLI